MMTRLAGRATLWAVIGFLYGPMLVLIAYSFNDSRFATSWQGFTFRWYQRLFETPEIAAALKNTLIVSISSTAVATVLGTLLAVGLHFRGRVRGRGVIEALIFLPVVLPDIVMGVALLGSFVAIQFTLGYATIILSHVAFQISFVALVVRGRLQGFPTGVLEAARDLGASPARAFLHIVLPLIGPAVTAGALIAFALSIDDFVITYFTAGAGTSTLPIRIYSMVKRGVTPDVNALSTLLLLVTFVSIALALRLGGGAENRGRPG